MKNLLSLPAVFILCSIIFLSPGCGGGGGGGSDSGAAGGTGTVSFAPQSVAGRSVLLNEVNRPEQTIQFAVSGNGYVRVVTGESQQSGTYTYSASDNSATLRLVDSATNEGITITLTFDSETSGHFTYSSTSGASGSGTFRNFSVVSNGGSGTLPSPGNPGTVPGGNTNPPPSGNSGGTPPAGGGSNPGNDTGGLNGRVISMTRSTGQTHTYTFTETRFVDSDPPEEGSGTYTYSRAGAQATLILNYTGSNGVVNLAGDRHEIRLNFSTGERGSYDSTYTRNDGAVLPQTGTFEFVQ